MASKHTNVDTWVKYASKSRPGRYYLFNASTGETKWIRNEIEQTSAMNERTPKLPVLKTPAQNRLKRLQASLKIHQFKSPVSRSRQVELNPKISNTTKTRTSNNLNVVSSTITTSAETDKAKTSTPVSVKCKSLVEQDLPEKMLRNHLPVKPVKRKLLVEDDLPKNRLKIPDSADTLETSTNSRPKPSEHLYVKILSDFATNLKNKIMEFYRREVDVIIGKSSESDKSTARISSRDTNGTVNPLKDFNARKSSKSLNELRCPTDVVGYKKGTANSRLKSLRESLQRRSSSETELNVLSDFGSTLNNNIINIKSTESLNNTIISTDEEPMDWEPVDNTEIKETSVAGSSLISSPKERFENITNSKYDSMGDIYDTVNENLLRISAEQNKDRTNNNNKWLNQYYYFVLDTNVLLEYLTFIDDLSNFRLCDTKGTIVFIPYCVLQELDKLKQKSGNQEGVKTLAVRAIKYLNKKFENKSQHLQAQSAIDERRHLIRITSPDDSIINSCLQVMEHVKNIMFLTEDTNLRNKAICNNIPVTTKSDLLTKQYKLAKNHDKL
uniref:PINc domain-containing protein n=1 Tax=Glossina brevipalpis TaxID=37001 RepID=A0A1A9W6A4_9MUSC